MRASPALHALSIGLLLVTQANPTFGHCGVDRSNLTEADRRRLAEWDESVETAQNLADLFELAVNAIVCAGLADELSMTTSEQISCLANGSDALEQERAARLRSVVQATQGRYPTDVDKRNFLVDNGWEQFLADE
jgi:hypothetical protein